VPSLKNTIQIFLDTFSIQYFTVLVSRQFMTALLFSFAKYENNNISKMKKRYSKKENAILLKFEKPFKYM